MSADPAGEYYGYDGPIEDGLNSALETSREDFSWTPANVQNPWFE
jgi:hypothetical protein